MNMARRPRASLPGGLGAHPPELPDPNATACRPGFTRPRKLLLAHHSSPTISQVGLASTDNLDLYQAADHQSALWFDGELGAPVLTDGRLEKAALKIDSFMVPHKREPGALNSQNRGKVKKK